MSQPVAAQVLTIRAATNARVNADLEIGAGNIWPDAEGSDQLGAGVWILARKVSNERKHRRVKVGEKFAESGYAFEVLDIGKTSDGAYVRLQVSAK